MLSAPGLGSGLDVNGIVSSLMAIERQPLNRMEGDKRELETQLSAFGQLKSALTTFQTAQNDLKSLGDFEVYKAESSDETGFTATATSSAAPGFSSIQVIDLADYHKMGSVAIADFDTTTLGGGDDQMTFTVDGESFSITAGGLTLSQIRAAINDASDNTGVTATIVSENTGSHRLVLSSTETGNDNAIGLATTGSVGSALGLTDINDPLDLDSEVLVDGLYTITRSSNTISDAISGITLELEGVTTASVELNVSRDVEAVTESMQAFVDSYNELNTVIDDLSGEGNDLEADNTLRSIESQIRTLFNTPPTGLTGIYTSLSQVGVSFQRDGTLSLDSTTLETAINTEFSDIAELFANDDQGYLFRLDSLLDGFVQADGLIDIREDGINLRIDTTEQRILDLEYRLELREQRLFDQFTTLDTLMSSLQGTSQFLTQQLASLPTISA